MKFKKLIVENFGPHKKRIIEFNEKPIYIYGDNRVGKTFIRNALQWVIVGRARNMQKIDDRKMENELINTEAKKMAVGIMFEDGTTIEKMKSKSGAPKIKIIKGDKMIDEASQADVWELFGESTPDKLDACLGGKSLLSMPLPERKELIFKLLNVKYSAEVTVKYLKKWEIDETFHQNILDEIKKGKFSGALEWAKENRKEYFALSRSKPVKPDTKIINFNNRSYSIDDSTLLDLVTKSIAEYERAEPELNQKLGSLRTKKESIEEQLAQLDREESELNEELKAAKTHQAKTDELPKFEKEYKERTKSLTELEMSATTKQTEINILKSHVASLDGNINLCPICESEMEKTKTSRILEKLADRIQKLVDEFQDCQSKIAQSRLDTHRLRTEIDGLKVIGDTKSLIEENEKRLRVIASTRKNLEDDFPNTDEISNQLQQIIVKKTRLDLIKKEIAQYNEEYQKFEESSKEKAGAKNKYDLWEKIVKALSPDGIMNDILNESLQPLKSHIEGINDFQLIEPLSVNPDFSFNIGNRSEHQIDKQFSSELMGFNWIGQEIISWFSDLKIACFDCVDILSSKNKMNLIQLIVALKEAYYNNLILFSTFTQPLPDDDPLRNYFDFVWIE